MGLENSKISKIIVAKADALRCQACASGDSKHENSLATRRFGLELLRLCCRELQQSKPRA